MLEARHVARRAGPFEGVKPEAFREVAVAARPGGARFVLRLRGEAPAGPAFGLDLGMNRLWTEGESFAARLGPDEWLVGSVDEDAEALQKDVEAALAGRLFALTDVSHRNVGFAIHGRRAAEALNGGCPLDLSDAAFPAGAATRTLLGKSEIVLMRPGVAPTFHVECWRSFAPYVHRFLIDAARAAGA